MSVELSQPIRNDFINYVENLEKENHNKYCKISGYFGDAARGRIPDIVITELEKMDVQDPQSEEALKAEKEKFKKLEGRVRSENMLAGAASGYCVIFIVFVVVLFLCASKNEGFDNWDCKGVSIGGGIAALITIQLYVSSKLQALNKKEKEELATAPLQERDITYTIEHSYLPTERIFKSMTWDELEKRIGNTERHGTLSKNSIRIFKKALEDHKHKVSVTALQVQITKNDEQIAPLEKMSNAKQVAIDSQDSGSQAGQREIGTLQGQRNVLLDAISTYRTINRKLEDKIKKLEQDVPESIIREAVHQHSQEQTAKASKSKDKEIPLS